jgi:hypothetical protein
VHAANDCILPPRFARLEPSTLDRGSTTPKTALVVLYIVRSVRTYLSLKQFGGHWSAGWSRLWLLKTQSSGEMHKRFAALNRKHG